jgi:hypothetical protein
MNQFKIEKPEKIGVCQQEVFLREFFIHMACRESCPAYNPCTRFNFRDFLYKTGNQWSTGIGRMNSLSLKGTFHIQPVNPVIASMKMIIPQFILYIKKNKKTTGDPESQSGNIDKRENLMSENIAKYNDEIVSYHEAGLQEKK